MGLKGRDGSNVKTKNIKVSMKVNNTIIRLIKVKCLFNVSILWNRNWTNIPYNINILIPTDCILLLRIFLAYITARIINKLKRRTVTIVEIKSVKPFTNVYILNNAIKYHDKKPNF